MHTRTQVPAEHERSEAQGLLQRPQWAPSVCGSTHLSPQRSEPEGHAASGEGASLMGTSSAGTSSEGTSSEGTSSVGTSGAGTSIAGTSSAGTSIAGTSSVGTSTAGTSTAGTSTAGTSTAGTSARGVSEGTAASGRGPGCSLASSASTRKEQPVSAIARSARKGGDGLRMMVRPGRLPRTARSALQGSNLHGPDRRRPRLFSPRVHPTRRRSPREPSRVRSSTSSARSTLRPSRAGGSR